MKSILSLIICLLFVTAVNADDTKYIEAMKKNIYSIDTLKTVEGYLETANAFQRIGSAEKDKWLPYYYAAMLYTLTCFTDQDVSKKDSYLDQAAKLISLADSLKPNESEIYTLKGMIAQGRIQIDPMNRYMQYGQEMNGSFEKAIQLNPANPRPIYLMAVTKMYTPEQFGGGAAAAKPMFEEAMKKFDAFVPENGLMPIWGKESASNFMKQMPQ
jgi:hypothetical protein